MKEIDKWIKRPPSTISASTLHCALESGKKSWLLATQFPDQEQPSLYSIEGGDAERLMLKLTAARDRWAKVSDALPIVTLCSAGRTRTPMACCDSTFRRAPTCQCTR